MSARLPAKTSGGSVRAAVISAALFIAFREMQFIAELSSADAVQDLQLLLLSVLRVPEISQNFRKELREKG